MKTLFDELAEISYLLSKSEEKVRHLLDIEIRLKEALHERELLRKRMQEKIAAIEGTVPQAETPEARRLDILQRIAEAARNDEALRRMS